MLNVGLTGNIASGKSTVAQMFREWGARIIDADELVRSVEVPGSEVLQRIGARFGADLILPDGALDRAGLRQRVMGNDALRLALNAIVHPYVAVARTNAIEAARKHGDRILVQDIPLLFEVLDPASFDCVVLVDAPADVRRERLMAARGLPRAEADALIGAQMPSEQKRARSQIVIDNHGTLAELEKKTREAWKEIERRAARA